MRRTSATLLLAAALVATFLPLPSAAAAPAAAATAALACSKGSIPAAAGKPVSLRVALGSTTATLTGTSGTPYLGVSRLRGATLTRRAGGGAAWTVHPKPVADTPGRGVLVAAVHGSTGDAIGSLCLARFRPHGRIVALLGVTSAFNQCCYAVRTYAPGIRSSSALQGGITVTRVRNVGDHVVLRGGDDGFYGQFADFADSVPPVRIIGMRDGHQADVSRSHRGTLRRDARRWWRAYEHSHFGLGFLAAWAADQERLGHGSRVDSTLTDLNAHGRLRVPAGLEDLWPSGSAYIKALHAFLAQRGYI